VNKYYHLKEKLGSGSHGKIFHVCNVLTSQEFAVKLSLANNPASTLHHEYEIVCKLQGILSIPQVISFGREPPYNVMILKCLRPSLDKVFNSCCQSFSPHTITTIGQQLVHPTLSIHLCNFIHHDVKPSNILIGTGQDTSLLYLIDFSIAKQYRNPYTHLHNEFRNCGSFLGSHAFASISSQLGFERGRQDDIESLAYILIYFSCGSLLWLGHPCLDSDAIVSMKKDVLQHDDIPQPLLTMLSYSQSLCFMQKLDYPYLQTLMEGI
ncbi:hypothetical protein PISMIDRAFT_57600, partial [Pisolithus microcarpus 441]